MKRWEHWNNMAYRRVCRTNSGLFHGHKSLVTFDIKIEGRSKSRLLLVTSRWVTVQLPCLSSSIEVSNEDILDRTSGYRLTNCRLINRYRSILDISSIDRYRSIYRSIAIPPSIDIERSQVSRYFDISSIEPALLVVSTVPQSCWKSRILAFSPHFCENVPHFGLISK